MARFTADGKPIWVVWHATGTGQVTFPVGPDGIISPDIDGDGILNDEDEDMDGDGMPNDYEYANELHAFVHDADDDADGDGMSNGSGTQIPIGFTLARVGR